MSCKALRVLGAVLIGAVLLSSVVRAADPTDQVFESGYVLVRCMAPPSHPQVSTAVFNAGFPEWISFVQTQADAGVVERAHYLSELKDGLFIVVAGETRQVALDNALSVIDRMNAILDQAITASGETVSFATTDACQRTEIGPLAVLPRRG